MDSTVVPILTLLVIAVVVAVASRRLRVPFNIALVLTGIVLGRVAGPQTPSAPTPPANPPTPGVTAPNTGQGQGQGHGHGHDAGPQKHGQQQHGEAAAVPIPRFALDPAVIFNVFLPVLLFGAALNTSLSEFAENIGPIAGLAIAGTFGAVVLIGWLLSVTVFADQENALLLGLLMGAVLATTDTISVLTVFKTVRVPGRLASIIEGESLFNDGASLVAFTLILELLRRKVAAASGDPAAAAAGSPEGVQVGTVVAMTAVVVLGGAAVGAAVGFFAGQLARQVGDPLTNLMLTAAVAYGSYIGAEAVHISGGLHLSGVIATVTAGLVFRGVGWTNELSAGSRLAMLSFWEFADFLVNSFVFLLLGFQLRFDEMLGHLGPIGWGLLAVHGARILTVYPLLFIGRAAGRPVPLAWQHVLIAGNIKGAVSAAMVLLVKPELVGHEAHALMINITFGTVLVTLLTQGLSLGRLLRAMGLGGMSDGEREWQALQMRLLAARSALRELDRLTDAGLVSALNQRHLRSRYQLAISQAEKGLQEMQESGQLDESARRLIATQRQLLAVEKSAILDAVRDKIVNEEAAEHLVARIDEQMLAMGRHLDER